MPSPIFTGPSEASRADLLVEASGNDAGGFRASAAYVLYGSEDRLI